MKKDGKYRFSLQFSSETEEEVMVGEFLERLGNKKSELIVPVLAEYLVLHPELQVSQGKIEVKITSCYNQDRIEQIVRSIVEEKFSTIQNSGIDTGIVQIESGAIEADVAKMLDNLNLFQ